MSLSSVTLKQLRSDLRHRLNEITEDNFVDELLNRWLNLGQYEAAVKLNGISDVWYGSETVVITANIAQEQMGNISSVDISGLNILKIVDVMYVDDANTKIEILPLVEYFKLIGLLNNSYFAATKYVSAVFGEKLYLSIPKTTLDTITAGVDSTADTAEGIDNSTDPVEVEIGTGYDHVVGDHVQIDSEIFRITVFALSPLRKLTLARNQWGTTIAAHNSSADIYNMLFKIALNYYRKPVEMTSSLNMDIPTEYQDLLIMFAMTKALGTKDMVQEKNQMEDEIKSKLKEIKRSFLQGDTNDISPVKKQS